MVTSGSSSIELIKPPELKLRLKDNSKILTEDMKSKLAKELNPILLMRNWCLLFCIDTDGVSMRTFFNKLKGHKSTILLVKDKNGNVFGAVLTEQWHSSSRFYGTGESFLFSFKVKRRVMVGGAEGDNEL
jgi:hypothetical protein